MADGHSRFRKVRFYANVTVLYVLTVAFLAYVIHPVPSLANASKAAALSRQAQNPYVPPGTAVKTISGRPVRIVVPSAPIDLPVDPGYYNSADGSWTLS